MEKLFEVLGWFRIVLSPLLCAILAGIVIYRNYPNQNGMIAAAAICLAGLFIGILWANRQLKGKGTIHFLSRVMATPELDKESDIK